MSPHSPTHEPSIPVPSGIVVTVPSSPEAPSQSSPDDRRRLPVASKFAIPSNYNFTFQAVNNLQVPAPPPPTPRTDPPPVNSHFQQLLETAELPEPGPEHFAARRALWQKSALTPPPPSDPSVSRRRLEHLLNANTLDSDEVWNGGLEKVWRGIINGAKLKKGLPLHFLIKILQAGWIRDGTWPRGGIAPDDDDSAAAGDNNDNGFKQA